MVVEETGSGWTITMTRSSEPALGGDFRLRLVGARLCELDAVLTRILERGRPVRVAVPGADVGSGPIPAEGNRFPPSVLVRPLLMPLHIDDGLYPYQRQGVAWLLRHPRALLADDMGLGKTAQAIGAVRRLVRLGRIRWGLVVAPRTLVANWIAEARRWGPELAVASILQTGANRSEVWEKVIGRAHLVVTSYEQLREPPEPLVDGPPDLIIADEAHRLRKNEAQATQGIRKVVSPYIWELTGTPVERDAEDLAVLMSIIEPRHFSPDDRVLHPSTLRARSRPYILRRSKEDVLRDLPAVIERSEELVLTQAQLRAYRAAIVNQARRPRETSFLALFNELRSLCDIEPASGASSKLDRIVELLGELSVTDEKAVVFSYLLAPLRELVRRLNCIPSIGYVLLTGDMSVVQRQQSLSRFSSDPGCVALLGSSRVASEGLTLTSANHVMFVNRWWNPTANAQARDRVVRIGQEKTVQTWTFVCRGTVETRLDTILKRKEETFEDLIEAIRASDVEDLADLFAEPDD